MSVKPANVIFPVSALYIQLDTNTGKDGASDIQLFKRSMIKMPKMDAPPRMNSEYPFFTKNVRYPDSIERAEWKTKYEFFFNRDMFMDTLKKHITTHPDSYRELLTSNDEDKNSELYEWMISTEKHNIMITLRALFPIPEVFGKALKNSHDHVLKSKNNLRVAWDVNVRSAANIFGFMYKFGIMNKEKEEYSINIGGKRYSVDDVIWENDIINHPVYNEFLKSQRETYEDVTNSAPEVEVKYNEIVNKLKTYMEILGSNQDVQYYFYQYMDCITTDCDQKKFYDYITSIQAYSFSEFKETYAPAKKLKRGIQLMFHKFLFREIDTDRSNDPDQEIKDNYIEFKKRYDNIETEKHDDDNKTVLDDPASPISIAIYNNYALEASAIFSIRYKEDDSLSESAEEFEDNLLLELFNDLKTDSILMLKMHILAKYTAPNTKSFGVTSADRNKVIHSVGIKFDRLASEKNMPSAAELIIDIKDDFDKHASAPRGDNISFFMDRNYEKMFNRLLKMAIEIQAVSTVLKFAKNRIPMNLTGKKPDGTEVSQTYQRVNQHIKEFFGTEAAINNKLYDNVKNVYEPVRKSSNKNLYNVLRFFKLGESTMKREYTTLTDKDFVEYRDIMNTIYDQYILSISEITDKPNKYLYTGVDEVKSTANTNANTNTNANEKNEVRRNVYEIYVRMDLVNADSLEKVNRSSCKLLDKELEQEYMYLVDPLNKNNMSLSRYRNFDFESMAPNPLIAAVESTKPDEVKNATNPPQNAVKNTDGKKTRKQNIPQNKKKRKTERNQ